MVSQPGTKRLRTSAGNRFYVLLNAIGAAIFLNRTIIFPDKAFPNDHHIFPELLAYQERMWSFMELQRELERRGCMKAWAAQRQLQGRRPFELHDSVWTGFQ